MCNIAMYWFYWICDAVVLDLQRDLNLPVVIDLLPDGTFEVRTKTIMRKKNFKTPNKRIMY